MNRGGNGRNGDGTWPTTDGRGCPFCGQINGGGHGGGCPNVMRYDEHGKARFDGYRRWHEGDDGPTCSCGSVTRVRQLPDGRWMALCLVHETGSGSYRFLPDTPDSLPKSPESG